MTRLRTALLLGASLAAGAVVAGCSMTASKAGSGETGPRSASSASAGAAAGNVAPDFQLTLMDGSSVSLGEMRGRPAVLIFWTAWCPVCKEEAPRINELAGRYEPLGVYVLGINIQDSQARTESGIQSFGIRYPVARDADASVARRYKVTGTPTIVFLDRNGLIQYAGNELPADYSARLDGLFSR